MDILIPVHQFEIRYSPILGFSEIIRKVLNPFLPLTTAVKIENENRISEKYILTFENQLYSIFASWDRLIFRFEGDVKSLVEKNSIIEEPFLNIFQRLSQDENFGVIKNCLSHILFINIFNKDLSREDITRNFLKQYFNSNFIQGELKEPTDLAIVYENRSPNSQVKLTFGPYFGLEELEKRNISFSGENIVTNGNKFGEMAEVNVLEITDSVSFNKYKSTIQKSYKIIEQIWRDK